MTKLAVKDTKKTGKDVKATIRMKKLIVRKNSDDGCCRCMSQYVTFIIVVFGLTFLHLRKFQYNTKFISAYGEGELSIRHAANDLNTILCENYELSAWEPLDVYLTSGEARVDKVNRQIVTRSNNTLYPNSPVLDNSFYLLEGSVINANVCRTHARTASNDVKVEFLIFKGDDSWSKFRNNRCKEDCALRNVSLPLDTYCEDNRQFLMTYTVTDRDSYRVAFAYTLDGFYTVFMPLRAEVNINKTIFDTTDARKVCSKKSKCVVPLQYDQDADIVVQFDGSRFLNTNCQFRFMFCIGIFVILPAFLLILGFTCCAAITISERKQTKQKKMKEEVNNKLQVQQLEVDVEDVNVEDRSSLVNNELPPAYVSVNNV